MDDAKTKTIVLTRSELPLHCPRDEDSAWNSHPRVFIPIEDNPDLSAQCPYCGSKYQLQD